MIGTTLALMRCRAGLPMYRTGKWQNHFKVPLPASTQWELIEAASETPQAIYEALISLAAQATSIFSKTAQRQIALFFTGQKHAGENLNQLLQCRAAGPSQPTQMSIRQLLGHNIDAEMEKMCLRMFTAWSMFTQP